MQLVFLMVLIHSALFLSEASVEAHDAEYRVYPVLESNTQFQRRSVYHTVTLSQIPWSSGRFILSGSPTGKDPSDIGEKIRIENLLSPSTRRYIYDAGYREKPMPPLDITYLMNGYPNQGTTTSLRIAFLSQYAGSIDIGPLYVVHIDDSNIKPAPFLILPWDYESKGLSFEQAALSMQIAFDHTYPVSTVDSSLEVDNRDTITSFDGQVRNDVFSGYGGYAWGHEAGVVAGTPIYAAAAGDAYFVLDETCGSMVVVNHTNDYQTRYCQIEPEESIRYASEVGLQVEVQQGDILGVVTSKPTMTLKPALYFILIQDIDEDGVYDDNLINSAVDPFGWQSNEIDPWSQDNTATVHPDATGTRSWYLWQTPLPNTDLSLPSTLGSPSFTVGKSRFAFSTGVHSQDGIVRFRTLRKTSIPSVDTSLEPLSIIYRVTIDNGFSETVTQFRPGKYMYPRISFPASILPLYVPSSVGIYSSTDEGKTWEYEESSILDSNGVFTAQVNHLTDFAVLGEKIDSVAPITEMLINGKPPESAYEGGSLSLSFRVPSGEDVSTLYRLNKSTWRRYYEPVQIDRHESYKVEYFSEDESGNVEDVQAYIFQLKSLVPTPTPTLSATPTLTPIPTQRPVATRTPTPQETSNASSQTSQVPTLSPSPTVIVLSYNHDVTIKPTSIESDEFDNVQEDVLGATSEQIPKMRRTGMVNIVKMIIVLLLAFTVFLSLKVVERMRVSTDKDYYYSKYDTRRSRGHSI